MDPRVIKTILFSVAMWICLVGPLMLGLYLEGVGTIPNLAETVAANPVYLLALVPGGILLVKRVLTGRFL